VSGKNVIIVGTFVILAASMVSPNSNRYVNATVLPMDGNEIMGRVANKTIDSGFDSFLHHEFKLNISDASVIRTGERIAVTTCSPLQKFDTMTTVYRDEYCSVEPYLYQHLLLESIDNSAYIELSANEYDESPGTGGTMTDSRMTTVVWGRKQGHKYKIWSSEWNCRDFDSHCFVNFPVQGMQRAPRFGMEWGELASVSLLQHAMRERIPTP